MDILYKIGDKITAIYSEYNADEGRHISKSLTGYIFAIEISQEGVCMGKKGYSVRYKVHANFEGMHGGWHYVPQNSITKIGEHPNATKYQNIV